MSSKIKVGVGMGLKLGQYIKGIRKEKNKPVRFLAEKSGISRSYIGYIENGMREPSTEILAKIAAALDISLDALLEIQKSEQLGKTIDRLKEDSTNHKVDPTEVNTIESNRNSKNTNDDEALKKVQKSFEETTNSQFLAEYIVDANIRAIFKVCNELPDEDIIRVRKLLESLYPDAFNK